MTQKQAEKIEVQVARIEERINSDRKQHAIQFKHLGNELAEIKSMLKVHISDAETDKIQFAFVVKKISDLDNINSDLKEYKNKMKYWEIFQDWKRIPFWTFLAIFIVSAKDELKVLLDSILNKFTGQ